MDALAFDPSFIRKHRFYPARGPIQNRWRQAKIEQDQILGTFVALSARLGEEVLARTVFDARVAE